jgi:predicted transcriptional regulator
MVDIFKLKFTVLQQELLRYLYLHAGTTFNANQLAKRIGVSQTAIAKALPSLVKEGLLKQEQDKESGRYSIELNRDNPQVIVLKRAENLKMLYESGLPNYLFETLPGTTIILFGSFSRGDDTAASDIDIAIVGTNEKKLGLSSFEKKLGREIVCNFYGSLTEIHKNLRNNLLNGIVLSGSIEL